MSDETRFRTLLVDYHDHISVPPVLVVDDVRRGRRRVRRNRALVTGGVAMAVACAVALVAVLTGGVRDTRQQPAVPSPTPVSDPLPANGQVTGAAAHFGAQATDYQWRAFDPESDAGLFVSGPRCDAPCADSQRFIVVGPQGPLASLPCSCRGGDAAVAATLGPGSDEVTLEISDRKAQVVGYDGRVRRAVDLAASLAPGEAILKLAWAGNSGPLAVLSRQATGGANVSRVWLVEPNGSARLAYSMMDRQRYQGAPPPTLRGEDFDARGYISTLGGWSPDGQVLLLDVWTVSRSAGVGASVVALQLQPSGASRPATPRALFRSDRHFDWAGSLAWSPDGTRVAVRTSTHIAEISPVDGRVLAQRPHVGGWLVWPRAEG